MMKRSNFLLDMWYMLWTKKEMCTVIFCLWAWRKLKGHQDLIYIFCCRELKLNKKNATIAGAPHILYPKQGMTMYFLNLPVLWIMWWPFSWSVWCCFFPFFWGGTFYEAWLNQVLWTEEEGFSQDRSLDGDRWQECSLQLRVASRWSYRF